MTVGPLYDLRERQAATRLAAEHPAWLIMWGTFSRRYWAIPAFPAPAIISATSVGGLLARIREAELAVTAGSPHARRAPQPGQPTEGGPRHA